MSKIQADCHHPLTDAYFWLSGYQQRSSLEGKNSSSFHPWFPALGNHGCRESQHSLKRNVSFSAAQKPGYHLIIQEQQALELLSCTFPTEISLGAKNLLERFPSFPLESLPVQKEMPNPDTWDEFEGIQQTSENWGHIVKDLSSLLLVSQPPKNIIFPLLNVFFNLKDKYFCTFPGLLNVCKRLKGTNEFLPAFQTSLPEGLHLALIHLAPPPPAAQPSSSRVLRTLLALS